MDLSNLWIGDTVKIVSNGTTGKFEGAEKPNVAKVKVGTKYVMVEAKDLEVVEADMEDVFAQAQKLETLSPVEEEFDLIASVEFNRTLDLHLDKWNYQKAWQYQEANELEFQKNQCKKFLKEAIALKVERVVIIHGIGGGVLKSQIEWLLEKYEEVQRFASINGGGAMEVWLTYD